MVETNNKCFGTATLIRQDANSYRLMATIFDDSNDRLIEIKPIEINRSKRDKDQQKSKDHMLTVNKNMSESKKKEKRVFNLNTDRIQTGFNKKICWILQNIKSNTFSFFVYLRVYKKY